MSLDGWLFEILYGIPLQLPRCNAVFYFELKALSEVAQAGKFVHASIAIHANRVPDGASPSWQPKFLDTPQTCSGTTTTLRVIYFLY